MIGLEHGNMTEATQAAERLARACIYVWSTDSHDSYGRDTAYRSRWQAAHALLMLSLGLKQHPRSFKGIRFDARGIAEWRQA